MENKQVISFISGQIFSTRTDSTLLDTISVNDLSLVRNILNSKWYIYNFCSDVPLTEEDIYTYRKGMVFNYPVYIRHIVDKLILLSLNHRIVEHLYRKRLSSNPQLNLRYTTVDVDKLVRDIASIYENKYDLTYIGAHYPTEGNTLNTVSLYGDDLAKANLFQNNQKLFVFYRCGLKEKSFSEDRIQSPEKYIGKDKTYEKSNVKEILKISNEGDLVLNLNEKNLVRLDATTNFFMINNYILA
jgi:hypothetical protein